MKKLLFAATAVEFFTLLVWGYGGCISPLPDWIVRLNGVIMLAAMGVLVFASVRVYKNS